MSEKNDEAAALAMLAWGAKHDSRVVLRATHARAILKLIERRQMLGGPGVPASTPEAHLEQMVAPGEDV